MAHTRLSVRRMASSVQQQRELACANRKLEGHRGEATQKDAETKPLVVEKIGFYENLVCKECGGRWKTSNLFNHLVHP